MTQKELLTAIAASTADFNFSQIVSILQMSFEAGIRSDLSEIGVGVHSILLGQGERRSVF